MRGVRAAAPCRCKKSQCLKLYCECLRFGRICGPECQCTGCKNCEGNQEREDFLERHKSQINFGGVGGPAVQITCRCKRSGCRKGYCDCFHAGVGCNERCGCDNCGNNKTAAPDHTHEPSESLVLPSIEECKEEFGPEESGLPSDENKFKTPSVHKNSAMKVMPTTASSKIVSSSKEPKKSPHELSALKPRDIGSELGKPASPVTTRARRKRLGK